MKLKPYVCSLLLALGFGSVAYADTAAPPPLPPEIQQQLLDAQKKVLAAETLLVEEKIRNQQKESLCTTIFLIPDFQDQNYPSILGSDQVRRP
jgi:hypothetical protein